MALHFTENKPNHQSASVPKTPFSIEDILYQNGNMQKNVLKSTCANTNANNGNFLSSDVNGISNENTVNSAFAKKTRNDNNDVNQSHAKDDEYRKSAPNER